MEPTFLSTSRLIMYIMMLLLVSSCSPNSESYPSNKVSEKFSPFRSDNIGKLQEINSWKVTDSEISLIEYNLFMNRLIVASEDSQQIINWNLTEHRVESVYLLPEVRILGMDGSGQKLLGAMEDQMTDNQNINNDYLQWIAVWDTNDGSQIICNQDICEEKLTSEHESTDIGAIIDSEGSAIVTYSADAYITVGLSSLEYSSLTLINDIDADYMWHIGNIAMDMRSNKLAIIFQEGRISLENLSPAGPLPLKRVFVLNKGVENELQPVHNTLFDPSGNWLAIVRGNKLSIWDIRGWRKEEIHTENVGTINAISFNPSSDFLFIAADDKTRIFDVERKTLILELQTPKITSLTISEDNRLLFWSDIRGMIHMWGIP